MRDIDELLELASYQEIEIPSKIEYRINYTLKNKNQYKNFTFYLKKIFVTIISLIIAIIGSITVYAASVGKLDGIPVIGRLGLKVSEQYNDYKEIQNIKTETFSKTSVELVATLASDYVTIFEFDVKLSDEDKEYLRLGKSVFNKEEYQKNIENYKDKAKKELLRINEYATPTEDEILEKAEEMFNESYGRKIYEEDKKYINTVCLRFNVDKENDSIGVYRTDYPIIIDDEEIWCRNYESAEKISDNEYKIYHTFLLTDEDLKGKTDFTITLKNNILANIAELKEGETPSERFSVVNSPGNERYINIEGDFSAHVSKEKISENSNIIECENKISTNKNVRLEIEYVNLNPIQTIIKLKNTITGIDSNKSYYYESDKHNPIFLNYKITDENGKVLNCQYFETKKTLIRNNGEKEEWAPGDIKDMCYYKNGTFEMIRYIILEKSNSNSLIITPSYKIKKMTDVGMEDVIMDSIEIELN